MLIQETCSNCGAPLTATRPSGAVHCVFCEAELQRRATTMQRPPPAAFGPPPPVAFAPPAGSPVVAPPFVPIGPFPVRIAVGALLGFVALTVLVFVGQLRPGPVAPRLTIDRLHDAELSPAETPLAAPPFVGHAGDFDAVANVGWASAVGRAWWPDAQLTMIDVARVTRDGTVDLRAPKAKVTYAFSSKRCIAVANKRAETAINPRESSCELLIAVRGEGRVSVALSLGRPDDSPPMAAPRCTVRQVFQHFDRTKDLPVRPTYHARLSAWLRDEPFWTIDEGPDSASIDRSASLAASFCKA